MSAEDRQAIIVALDFSDEKQVLSLVENLSPNSVRLKVGKQLFTRQGPKIVESLVSKGFKIFLDLKFHDIPVTVAHACHAAADLGVWMMNVHACGGRRMMQAAREELEKLSAQRPRLIAVTVLTSLDGSDITEIGMSGEVEENVMRLAKLAFESGMDGVVCSAHEVKTMRREITDEFLLVTPGIRPAFSVTRDDQRRVATPKQALSDGADFLVIGRPITGSEDPRQAVAAIYQEVNE